MANKLTRRSFQKRLLAAGALPFLASPLDEVQEPATIAGYTPSAEEQALVASFLHAHNARMMGLQNEDLPNSLVPAVTFSCPVPQKKQAR